MEAVDHGWENIADKEAAHPVTRTQKERGGAKVPLFPSREYTDGLRPSARFLPPPPNRPTGWETNP